MKLTSGLHKLNDNLFAINWFNCMKFIRQTQIKSCDMKKDIIVDEKDLNNIFPYSLLNIDNIHELLYKHDNEWYLLLYHCFETNIVMRCQQGNYREYKITYIDNNKFMLSKQYTHLFQNIYNEHYNDDIDNFDHIKQYISQDDDDSIIKMLSQSNKLHYYEWNHYDDEIIIELVDFEYSKNKLTIKYQDKQYEYDECLHYGCCGEGDYTFIIKNINKF